MGGYNYMKRILTFSLISALFFGSAFAGDVASFVDKGFTEDGKYYIKTWPEISSNIEGRAYSPKNRMYTLQVGVLNS